MAIVPMFPPMRGLIYAALMSGADLVLPDRHLQAAPLVSIIEETRQTIAGAVPTIWNDVDRTWNRIPPGISPHFGWLPARDRQSPSR